MNELEKIAETFGQNRPIFEGRIAGSDIVFTVKPEYAYDPAAQDYNDPIAAVMAAHYNQYLSVGEKRYHKHISLDSVYGQILGYFLKYVENSSELKNPRQTKLYKWLVKLEANQHSPVMPGFIALFRYSRSVHTFSDVESKGILRSDDPHVKNVIGILELMRAKYERE